MEENDQHFPPQAKRAEEKLPKSDSLLKDQEATIDASGELALEETSFSALKADAPFNSRGILLNAPQTPKGIIRKLTETFPEDPHPVREGVAPTKDAKKRKDFPTDTRWTKIDRQLISPEALEEVKERFEERADCVIVLRVLTKDEIEVLADRTWEIRETKMKQEEG
ncbi:hypothetical protein IWX49DRAFT_569043 [Phyllosticta citricarpa]|uniref:DUF8035 domain-containing protein n=1 Tax=Phyllosticta citricarpa TaxID=55181 RepID=A0ABR1LBV4_9PEZI